MWNARLDEAQAGIKITMRNISNLRYADDTTLTTESEEELKNILMEVKEEREKAGLKLNIWKMKTMTSGPIISWQIDGKQWKQWRTLFSWAWKLLQILTAVMKFKKMLAPWKKSYDKPRQHTKKQRYHFVNKGLYSQSYSFTSSHGWMFESCTLKNAELPKN